MTSIGRAPASAGGTGPSGRPLQVVLVEDEDLFRDLLRASLETDADLAVVGSFGDAPSALAVIPSLRPDVVLLDIQLGAELDSIHLGLELRRQLPGLGIVVLSQHADARFLAPLSRAAVSGWSYLLKSSVRERTVIARAIQGAARGEVVLDPWLVDRQQTRPGTPLARLAPRQREILGLVAQGWTNAAIADRLVLAEKSIEHALTTTYEHLGLDRRDGARHVRVQAVLAYLRDGAWSESPEPTGRPLAAAGVERSLPSAEREPAPVSKVVTPAPGMDTRHSVLLVDDQPAFLEAASRLLGTDPRLMIVGTATSGREALALLAHLQPEIVLLDVQMPGMNGFEVAQAMRALLSEVRIVFASSNDDPVYAAMARRLDGGFMPKGRLSAAAVLELAGRGD